MGGREKIQKELLWLNTDKKFYKPSQTNVQVIRRQDEAGQFSTKQQEVKYVSQSSTSKQT